MKKITFLFFVLSTLFSVNAQITIQGTVSDYFGPLPSTSIAIINTDKGIITNMDGEFSIDAKKGDVLSISYVGNITQEIVITDQRTIDVVLENEILEEVIIVSQPIKRTICYTKPTCLTEVSFRCSVHGIRLLPENTPSSEVKNTSSVYPNPSPNGVFKLKLPTDYKVIDYISVSNFDGRHIQNINTQNLRKEVIIDLSNYPSGMYFINHSIDGKPQPTLKAIRP